MQKIPKHEYTTEFKEREVKHVKEGKSISLSAKELGLVEQMLRNWIKLSAAGKLTCVGAKPATQEQINLSQLRAGNIRLKRECEILKKPRRTSREMQCEPEKAALVTRL